MSLYHEAAEILSTLPGQAGSLKSRVFGRRNAKSPASQLFALVFETCKWSAILKEVIDGAELLCHERKLTPELALLLVHDFLLAKGGIALPQNHGLRLCISRHKGRLSSEFTRARVRRRAASVDEMKRLIDKEAAGEEASHPRWVRVNVLKSSMEEQLETTFRSFTRAHTVQDVVAREGKHILVDAHVPNLVAVTPGYDLSKSEAYVSGKIIFQDKASCFPAYLLDARSEDGDVIDACAAPGNKTTHLAAIIHAHTPDFESAPQTIFAIEKDVRRAETLDKMIGIAGAKKMVRIGLGQDFLQVDPMSQKWKNVGALLLDPSCSGSGIVGRDSSPPLHLPRVPQQQAGKNRGDASSRLVSGEDKARKRKLHQAAEPDEPVIRDDDGNETMLKTEKDLDERLQALASFQRSLLVHAFRFPSARKITYSTCSVHSQENEHVVMAALESDIAKQGRWRILPRDDQIGGMRAWPVRGLVEACRGDGVVAEACIRSYKRDGHGTMGFFAAGFVRDVASSIGAEAEDGPYLRDETGTMVRDLLGMPTLRTTGVAVSLVAREGGGAGESLTAEDEQGEESDDDDDDYDDYDDDDDDDDDDEKESEWAGFED